MRKIPFLPLVAATALTLAVSSAGDAFHTATFDLAFASAEATIYGAEGGAVIGDRLGSGLASGDFNGDGIDDLLTGASSADGPMNARADAGEVYIVFGSASLSGVRDLLTAPPDFTLFGATANEGLGAGNLTAGDLNHDGMDDIIVGNGSGDGPNDARTNAGEVYVVFGASSFPPTFDLLGPGIGLVSLVVYGAEAGDVLRTAAAGDVNGDSIDDLVVGADAADGPANARQDGGEVYVIFGSNSLPLTWDLSTTPAQVTVYGAEEFDELSAVATGDLNNDAVDDLIMGAPRADGASNARTNAGEVYVLFGTNTPGVTIDIAGAPQDATIIGADAGDSVGPSSSADVNGDGVDDLIVAAIFADGPANNEASAGEAHVIFGGASLDPTTDLATPGQYFTVYGADAGDQVGFRSTIADVSAGGLNEVILAAPTADAVANAKNSAGEVYVIDGATMPTSSQDLGTSPARLTVLGAGADDLLGISSAASGDFNDDGAADLAIGARAADGSGDTRNSAGEVHVFLGENTDQCPLLPEDLDGFEDGDGCPDPDNDLDGVCDAGQTSVSCNGSDTGKQCFDPAGTLSCLTQDCRNQGEDVDAFKDTDGCPEPDNDNDSFPDTTDACPGTGSQAGADGMLGSPQDLNHNGISDGGEPPLTTDDVPTYAFEDRDGVLDTDGCHDSPGEDFDGDGFTDDAEALEIGTNPGYPCGNPGWPADLLADNRLNIGDFNSFLFPLRGDGSFNKIFHPVPDPDDATVARWDLQPSNVIDIGDLNALNPAVMAPTARPPMFGGLTAPAFFTDVGNGVGGCPFPP